jgi:hypothetical protein
MYERVLFLPEVREYFKELADTLYDCNYFGLKEQAKRYADGLFTDIEKNLPTKLKKRAPAYFNRYSKNMYYAVFKKNKNTQWYVFFSIYLKNGERIYLVKYLGNNHCVAQYLPK